ncbi:MAG: Gfo/Idh/MocA family oxidoreductase [Gemmatimonadota bacterium]|nr:Gfo/Idh/MocA family oxidoreductase [Gemmatimonadota bacterium]
MSSPPRISIALIGFGEIARTIHLPLLRALPGARLVAIAEVDPRLRRDGERAAPGSPCVADYRELLARPDIDAILIALPTALHRDAAIASLRAGKHVYLEKPLASTLADGRELLAAARRVDVVAMIGFNYRCHPLYERARRLLTSARIGTVLSIRTVFSTSRRDMPAWKSTRSSGGGVLLDLASHHMDLLRWLLPVEITTVSAELRSVYSEDDTAALQLAMGNDIIAQCFFTFGGVEEDRIEIHGSAGKMTVDRYRSRDVEVSAPLARRHALDVMAPVRALNGLPHVVRKLRSPGQEPSYRVALERFIAATRAGTSASPDFLDGYMSLAVIDAAERSALIGRAMPPDPPPSPSRSDAMSHTATSIGGGA